MGGFRSLPKTEKESMEKEYPGFTVAASSMCGWRMYMEDAHIFQPLADKNYLFAVFDGHGGAEVATFAKRYFVEELVRSRYYRERKYELALKDTFLRMDEKMATPEGKQKLKEIIAELKKNGNAPKDDDGESRAGCTANVLLMTPDFLYCANAGDSRATACTIKGDAKELTRDHKPEDEKQLARITKAGGEVSFGRVEGNLNLSRALGDLEYKRNKKLPPEAQMITADPTITRFENRGLDFVIMGCDGIWEAKNNTEMVQYLRAKMDDKKPNEKKKPLKVILEEMLDDIICKDSSTTEYGLDNMTAILIKFHNNNNNTNNNNTNNNNRK